MDNPEVVRIWDIATGEPLPGGVGVAGSVAFSPDGDTLAAAVLDEESEAGGVVHLYDHATGEVRMTLDEPPIALASPGHSIAFTPDGNTLATPGVDLDSSRAVTSTVILWDMATGESRATSPTLDVDEVSSVALSPDGSTLAAATFDVDEDPQIAVQLWDTATGQQLESFPVRYRAISLAFSPDGSILASGENEGAVTLWDIAAGDSSTLPGHTGNVASLAFSPDGRTLATATENADSEVRLWDIASREPRAVLTGHESGVAALAFSPDGNTLATAGLDGDVRLWDSMFGFTRTVFSGHSNEVVSLAFSPDGGTLASSSINISDIPDGDSPTGTVRLWDVAQPDPEAAIRKICEAVPRSLSSPEQSLYLRSDREHRPACPPNQATDGS